MSSAASQIRYCYVDSPLGEILLAGADDGLRELSFPGKSGRRPPRAGWVKAGEGDFAEARIQLAAYFARELEAFDLPLAPRGSAFQHSVWDALLQIPYGEVISYGEQAKRIGDPGAAQAVGAANGANPIAIVIPCHRVVGADGSLTGFTGGLHIKKFLLAHEQAMARSNDGQLRLI
ncbi:MAG: methylated-DNA--[protein]-cysteine S-methyltransferase [Pseudomonadota bacterium]